MSRALAIVQQFALNPQVDVGCRQPPIWQLAAGGDQLVHMSLQRTAATLLLPELGKRRPGWPSLPWPRAWQGLATGLELRLQVLDLLLQRKRRRVYSFLERWRRGSPLVRLASLPALVSEMDLLGIGAPCFPGAR